MADAVDDPTPQGTVRLFYLLGIPVYLHWTWGVVAVLQIQYGTGRYGSLLYNILEYLVLFGIVLLHELGHATACRSVGGEADRILLWPLGGVAYVRPPFRPGAQLWSIVAGPLVNLVLGALGIGAWLLIAPTSPDVNAGFQSFIAINVVLFVFNVLPIYPLDGGQIVRSLLWYVVGPVRSLAIAAGIGLAASVIGGLAAVIYLQGFWLGLIAAYAAWRSWQALVLARRATAHAAAQRG